LAGHPAFTLRNPNRARALVGGFAMGNQLRFHQADGRGYAWVTDKVLDLDKLNPSVAARIMTAFESWRRFDADRQAQMAGQFDRVLATEGLSDNLYEVAKRLRGSE
jgi:aminopeptidase N